MFTSLQERLDQVIPHKPIAVDAVAVVPFVGASRTAPAYAIYGQAVAEHVQIRELGVSGSVPLVRVQNDLDQPIFIIDGQQLIGAKQNRILNTDVLVAAKSGLDLPVSCVEQGRWRHTTPRFSPSVVAPRKVRGRKLERVNASVAAGAGFDGGQREVWNDVAECMNAVGASSPTGCLTHAFETKSADINSLREKIRSELPVGSVGFAVFIDEWFQGLELFDRASTLTDLFGTVFDGYAMDWLGWKLSGRRDQPLGLRYLDRVQDELLGAAWKASGALGLGSDWRLSSPRLVASALEWEGDVVHLQVFQAEGSAHPHRPLYVE